jgi:RimJ/RimL family protein N-acetyltransferase
MAHPYWPLFDLRVRTPRLELRYPSDRDLDALAAVLAEGIHDPDRMPFAHPWTRAESPDLERSAYRHWWRTRAEVEPASWSLPMVVVVDDERVGMQDVGAREFAVTRTVNTGSWLLQRAQGRGTGREMRAAVLHLAFAGLGAVAAYTSAFDDNPASLGVTRALGYEPNGSRLYAREGEPVRALEFVLTRERWEATRRHDIDIEGLEECRVLLGADPV